MVYILLRKDLKVFNPFRSLREEKDHGIFISYLLILHGNHYEEGDKPHVGIYDILTLFIPQLISEFTKYMKDWAEESDSTVIYLLSLPLRLINSVLMIPKLAFLFAASIAALPFISLYKGINYLLSPAESSEDECANGEAQYYQRWQRSSRKKEHSPEAALFDYQENHGRERTRGEVNGHRKRQVSGALLPKAARFTVFAQKTRVVSETQAKTRSVIEISSPT